MAIKRTKGAARRKPKELKADQYRCVGGPVDRLYLPGLKREGYVTPLPDEVVFPDGIYVRIYDPEAGSSYYDWRESG